jgi:deazaflavin-dependent oxidoreductase (nitroreductase family)
MNGADTIGEELADWGKVAILATVGRSSGRVGHAAVGFVEEPDGALVVAAGTDATDWALNLRAARGCSARIGDDSADYEAHELFGPDRNHAISALILKYGTPAERLGRGPAFRLSRRSEGDDDGR